MDRNKIDQQFDRRINKMARNMASESKDVPIEDYEREFFAGNVKYEDAEIEALIILCEERLNGEFNGVKLDTYGPWIIFRVRDVLEGDENGLIDMGAAIMARWDNKIKAYTKYLYKADPKPTDKEIQAMAAYLPITAEEIVRGWAK